MTRDERLGLFYIAKNITFRDVDKKSVDPYLVHQRQVSEWLFAPANILLATLGSTPINEMSLFGLQLMFFEMHGKFLEGKPARGDSAAKFKKAWRRFQSFCEATHPQAMSQNPKAEEVMWVHGRNGLFHALHISVALSIDYGEVLGNRLYGENPLLKQKLVSPRKIQLFLHNYFENYIRELKENTDSKMTQNFLRCYDVFIDKPLAFFADETNWNI